MEVVEDWLRAVKPYQMNFDGAETESAKQITVGSAFMELQPAFLKCLFSYAFFFVSVDNAYSNFYSDLNCANNLSGLHLNPNPPKR